MRAMVIARNTLLALLLTACSATAPSPSAEPPAPWNANAPVAAPRVVLDEWSRAENKASCAPMTIADPGDEMRNPTPRRANFSGGWGIAWDAPGLPGRDPSGAHCASCGRGVAGIAGAGITHGEDQFNGGFPHRIDYEGENWAGWALEGGTGPNWLAQFRVDDQQCVYYVWSFLGREHLESLLRNVRRVVVR